MLVDDDEAVLAAISFSLAVEGFQVAAFRSGEALIDHADWPRRGCLVIDYHLSGRDGLEVLAELRRRGIGLPAVLMTTDPSDSVRRRAAAVGADIMEKPLFGDALVDRLRRDREAG
jgi:FixJ family two-component response regulator